MPTLYFYCNNTVFTNIIRKKEIWLSDMNYSNDYAEIIGFTKPLVDIFKENITSIEFTLNEYGYDSKACMQKLIKMYENYVNNKLKSLYCLAICFSKRRDDLSQWRAYGDAGKGFAIGFNEEILLQIANSHKLLSLKEICYEETIKIKHITNYTINFINEIQEMIKKNKGRLDLFKKKGLFAQFISQKLDDILKYAPFYKNEGFRAEDEVRLAYIRTIFPIQFENIKPDSFLNKFDCRVNDDKIIPYLTVPINDNAKAISEIIIGPCNGTTLQTLSIFLAKHKVSTNNITESVVSFRIK